jgi:hypothetical protein
MSWKLLLGAGAVVGGGYYLLQLNRTSNQLETVVQARVHSIDLSAITVNVDVQLKNPTAGSLKLKYPFIRLQYQGETIGSSQVLNQDIELPKFGETTIQAIRVKIPLLSLSGLAKDLLKLLNGSNQGIALQAIITTTIDAGIGARLPYEKTETITLKK